MSNSSSDVVASRWALTHKIGAGGFGKVYLARVLHSRSDTVAIKISTGYDGQEQLHTENKVYRALHNTSQAAGFPRPIYFGPHMSQKALVMQYLGPCLEKRLVEVGRKMSLHTVYQIGIQLLRRIEFLHAKSYIHRDIKPDNLLMGRGSDSSILYVVDFGLAKRYRHPRTREHIPMRDGKSLTGTGRYCSVHTHQGFEQARRDDLETTAYVLVYLFKGRLPWTGIRAANSREKYARIRGMKENISTEELCRDMGSAMNEYFEHVRELAFESKPDYAYLRNLFRNGLHRRGLTEDGMFDWMKPDERRARRRARRRA